MNAISFPDGMSDMLRDFVVAVLRQKPTDIYEFAADFFVYLRDKHRMRNVPMYVYVEDDTEACEPDPSQFLPKIQKKTASLGPGGSGGTSLRSQRRRSIAAEKFDPEKESEVEQATVYPKTAEQKTKLVETLQKVMMFLDFDTDQLQVIADSMYLKQVEPGTKLINQGDKGDNFYVINHGHFDVYDETVGKKRKLLFSYDDEGYFGELAFMHNQPRSASVIGGGSVWVMSGKGFRELLMKISFKRKKIYDNLLRAVPMLDSLEENERMLLTDSLVPMKFTHDQCIIQEGTEAQGMYFIESGLVRVTIKKDDGSEAEVARISSGKYFGEMALVEKKLRSASVYAVGDTKLAFLELESFERLLGPCIGIMRRAMSKYKS